MPTYQIGSRPAQGKDFRRGFRPGQSVPVIATITKPGKYTPHIGAKESAKFIANLEPEQVPCEGCGEYGEPNYAGGKRYCGSQYCCP